MKWHEIGKTYGYPTAFRWPKWKDGEFIVLRSRGDIEVYRDGQRLSAEDELLGLVASLYFYWYEHDGWEPLFGFY